MRRKTTFVYDTDDFGELTISGTYDSGEAPCYYRSNGDPGDPGSPPEFEIEKILTDSKVDVSMDLPDDLIDLIVEKGIEEGSEEAWEDVDPDYADDSTDYWAVDNYRY